MSGWTGKYLALGHRCAWSVQSDPKTNADIQCPVYFQWLNDRRIGRLKGQMTQIANDSMTEWPSDRVTEWSNDRITELPNNRMADWLTDWMTERPNDWMTEGLWTTERLNEWTTRWLMTIYIAHSGWHAVPQSCVLFAIFFIPYNKFLTIKIAISSIVFALKNSYFRLIYLSSCYQTVCFWQFVIGHFNKLISQSCILNQPITNLGFHHQLFNYASFVRLLIQIFPFLKFLWSIGSKTLFRPIRSLIPLVINKSDSHCAVVRPCHHLYDNRPNWTPLSPIYITYCANLGQMLALPFFAFLWTLTPSSQFPSMRGSFHCPFFPLFKNSSPISWVQKGVFKMF